MTFDQIVSQAAERLNIVGTDGLARIGRSVNAYYKRVTSSLGIATARRTVVQATATIGVDTLTFAVTKLNHVEDRTTTPPTMLDEVSNEEIAEGSKGTTPTAYAVYSTTAHTVTIRMNATPATAFTLYAEGLAQAATLATTDEPAFDEDFHDILVLAAIYEERLKMEKTQLAMIAKAEYEDRLGDLRLSIAKTSQQDIYQGKRTNGSTTGSGGSSSSTPNGASSYTQTGLITFNRQPSLPPFAITAPSAKVTNLDADKLDGLDWTTAADVTSAAHGMAPISPGIAGKFLNGAATPGYAYPAYTNISSTVTGAQNNYAPALAGHTFISWGGASDVAFTGIAGGVLGQIVIFKNQTAAKIATFAHASGSSSVGNKFANNASSAPTPVAPGGYVIYQYDGTTWILVGHEQGAWITPAFNAGDYTAATGSWTLQSGDVASCAYRLSGNTLQVKLSLNTTTVSATPANLIRAIPGGFTSIAGAEYQWIRISDNGGASTSGMAIFAAATIAFYASPGGAGWSVATNTTAIQAGVLLCEVS